MKYLIVRETGTTCYLSLNRPDVRNAFHPELIQELIHFFQSPLRARVLVLSGEGNTFSAGADLNWMRSLLGSSKEQNIRDAENLRKLFLVQKEFPKPIVASVTGAVYGGALGMVALSDWVIADERTQFCFSEVLLGIAPAVVSEFILGKCSLALVAPWMLSGRAFSASEAKDCGLVQQISTIEDHQDLTESAVQQFLKTGPQAFTATKKLLMNFSDEQKRTIELIAQLRVSQEGQEGLASFLEKRKPSWVGQ